MRKNSIISIVAIIIIIGSYVVFMLMVYFKGNGINFNADFGSYLSGVFAPISAVGTIVVTYLIYKLTSAEKRADDDFRIIVGIYFRIQETYEALKKQDYQSTIDDNHNSYYERQIKVDCMLLLNYIRRYPNKNYDTQNIEMTIWGIYVNPSHESDYIVLANEIQRFCYELNPDWDSSVIKLD